MRILCAALLLILTACGPEPTPFPVDLPVTPTPAVTLAAGESQVPLPRYALAPETAGLIPDLALIQTSTQVIQLQEPVTHIDLGTAYEIVVTYGLYPDWTPSTLTPQVMLVLNPAAFPDSQLLPIVRRSIQPQAVIEALPFAGLVASPVEADLPINLRTALANMGLPDGVELTLADTSIPGTENVVEQMRRAGIFARRLVMTTNEARTALDAGQIQAALVLETEHAAWIERYGEENVINLYTLPVSYRVVEGRDVTFTPAGFPIIK